MIPFNQVPFEKLRVGDMCNRSTFNYGRITDLSRVVDAAAPEGIATVKWANGKSTELIHTKAIAINWVGHLDETP